MKKTSVTEALAEFIAESSLPPAALHGTKRAVLDALACAMAGREAPGVPEVAAQLLDWGGRPEATVWWRAHKLPAPAAAFANSVALHALDLDDVHIPSTTHITSVVVPTALAVGEAQEASGRDVLTAVALGVEAATRLAMPAKECRRSEGYLPTTVFGIFGAAAAAAHLLDLTAGQTAQAFGLAHAQVSGNRQALFDHTLAKRLQPAVAARAGIVSAYFASRGVTGARHAVEGTAGLFALYGADPEGVPEPDDMLREAETWEVERLSYKSYACCGASHPLLRAAIDLTVKHDLQLEDVLEAEIFGVSNPFAGVPWDPATPTQEQAQFCAPYQVAVAIKHRRFSPAEVDPDRIRHEDDVSQAAQRVKVAAGKNFPTGQTIRIRTTDGRTLTATRQREDVFVGAAMDDETLATKARGITGNDQFIEAVWHLDRVAQISDFTKEYLYEDS